MYKLTEWNEGLDLSSFNRKAQERGFLNNISQQKMIDTFRREKKWEAWILYYGDNPIGSVVAHTFPLMGDNAYRILARTCIFTDMIPGSLGNALRTKTVISEHQNLTDQFLLPACLDWVDGDAYATSNESEVASQRLVHRHYFPTLEKKGIVENMGEYYYRKTNQTVWKIHKDRFYESLYKYPRWQ